MDPDETLAAFDEQIRRRLVPPQPGWLTERVGRVVRTTAPAGRSWGSFVEWSDLDEASADGEIAAQVAYYSALGQPFEWKAYGYDRPADLADRLVAAGFVPGEEEALVVGWSADVAAACAGFAPPPGIVVREVRDDDWAAIAALKQAVWGGGGDGAVEEVAAELAADPTSITVLVAEVGAEAEAPGELACAGWVRFHTGTEFASLWGGGTRPAYRRLGIYRALVARRAELAAQRGFRYLQVDASPDSRPILERLGLRMLTTTTPYVWTPPEPSP